MKPTRQAIAALVAGIVISTPFHSDAAGMAPQASCESLASASARSPSEHRMLAGYFHRRAAELRERAARRRQTSSVFLSSKVASAPALKLQHDRDSRRDRAIAEEYDRMAAQHEAQASAGS